MTYFLIEHNRRTKRSNVTLFEDREASIRALNSKEAGRSLDTDVVLLIAESEANIRITHPKYFWSDETDVLSDVDGSDFAKYIVDLRELAEQRSSDS